MYDHDNYIRNQVKAFRGYVLPPSKQIPIEDLIANIVSIGEFEESMRKYYDIMRVDVALRKTNLDFKGFYTMVPYPFCLKQMVENYVDIMAQIPDEPMGEEASINPNSPKPNVNLEIEVEEEEKPSTSTWVAKGNKRQKVHIPERVMRRTLHTIPSNDQYFSNIKKNYLQDRVTKAGKSSTNLQIVTSRLDGRVIQSQKFTKNDDFIKSLEFKSFLYKVKQNELTLSLKPSEDAEKPKELVEKLLACDLDSQTMAPTKAR